MKLLAADSALSLQAHPTPERARAGFAAEEAAGIELTAPERNYKDPYAKPELIVAVEDGFEALCGFRPAGDARAEIIALAAHAARPDVFQRWSAAIGEGGPRAAVVWLLSGSKDTQELVAQIPSAAAHEPARFELLSRLAAQYPGDAGVAVALMLNHVTLRAGECLWLAAGNIHAYLRGLGVELMGPSDNVLRGGLTPKHVDVAALLDVLDVATGPAPYLPLEREGETVQLYRPGSVPSGEGVPFELRRITGPATMAASSPAILLVLGGGFDLTAEGERLAVHRGDALFVRAPTEIRFSGTGLAFLASAS